MKHVIICKTHALLDLYQSLETFRQELAAEGSYKTSIKEMRLRLVELQTKNGQARKIRVEKLGRNWEDSNRILNHKDLPYIPEIIKTKRINKHHDDPLAGHFSIKKTQKLVTRKYY